MITDHALRQHVYRSILKMASKRLEQAIPGSSEGACAHLSLAALLNLLFSCAANGAQSETMPRLNELFEPRSAMICCGLIPQGRRRHLLNWFNRSSTWRAMSCLEISTRRIGVAHTHVT